MAWTLRASPSTERSHGITVTGNSFCSSRSRAQRRHFIRAWLLEVALLVPFSFLPDMQLTTWTKTLFVPPWIICGIQTNSSPVRSVLRNNVPPGCRCGHRNTSVACFSDAPGVLGRMCARAVLLRMKKLIWKIKWRRNWIGLPER